jgi:sec-independent protein translocase protein TatA
MGMFQIEHILLVLVVGLLLFGRKLPEVGRSLGKTVTEFRKGVKGLEDEVSEPSGPRAAIEPEPVKPPQRVTPPTQKPQFDDLDRRAEAAPPATSVPPKV